MRYSMTKIILRTLTILVLSVSVMPAQASSTEEAGKYVAFALPVAAAGITAWKEDWQGTAQLGFSTLLTVGTAYGLKHVVREKRPDGLDFKSFPSDTAALAFAPAQFLMQRYGWEYGLPAYAAAGFVGYSRVEADRHHWYDVAASAALSFGFNYFITSKYQRKPWFNAGIEMQPGGGMIGMTCVF